MRESIRMIDAKQCWEAVLKRDRSFDGVFSSACSPPGCTAGPRVRRASRCAGTCDSIPPRARPSATGSVRACAAGRWPSRARSWREFTTLQVYRRSRRGAAHFGTSGRARGHEPVHLQRTFKAAVGLTPKQYIEACRLQSLKSALKQSHDVTEAVSDAGSAPPAVCTSARMHAWE